MGGPISRESYLETGLDVLSDLGYGGLKLAEVCNRLGVTTGSFYHYFSSWAVYCRELISHWSHVRTTKVRTKVATIADPRSRIAYVLREAVTLPLATEAAIRVWSAIDPAVGQIQAEVDRMRYDVLHEAAAEILRDQRTAQRFATTALYLLVGCEQTLLPRVPDDLQWIATQLLDALDSGKFGTVADAS